jgi:hypothetical protein
MTAELTTIGTRSGTVAETWGQSYSDLLEAMADQYQQEEPQLSG